MIAKFDDIEAVRCPCGFAKRAFAIPENRTATVHIVDIQSDSRTHYHKELTEIYIVLEGKGQMELDSKLIPIEPLTAIFIKPQCRHRAIGKMRILNIVIPPFDQKDEWFD